MQTVSFLFLPATLQIFLVSDQIREVHTFKDDGVALENLELVHLRCGHFNDRVIVLLRLLNLKLVRGLLGVHNGRRIVFLSKRDDKIKRDVTWLMRLTLSYFTVVFLQCILISHNPPI